MGMEIIEKPTHKCEECGCVFSFDKEDFQEMSVRIKRKEISVGHYSDTYLRQTYVSCPICRAAFIIKERKEDKYS